jgi:hypothetical protein
MNGTYVSTLTEPQNLGIIAIQLNGVGIYGAQEAGGTNAVEPGSTGTVVDGQYWYGHSAPTHDWFVISSFFFSIFHLS